MRKVWRGGMPTRDNRKFDRQLVGRAPIASAPNPLPLTHVTSSWKAKEAIFDGKLSARKCSVFLKELLYFFVLKPAYLQRAGDEKSHRVSQALVAFILQADCVPSPYHVYPFDSGAGAKGAYGGQADPEIPLEDYELEPDQSAAYRFIKWVFGTNRDYFEGRLRCDLRKELAAHECVANSYLDIAQLGIDGSYQHDKRASTVEVAASHNVDLSGNLRLIIVPKQFLEGYDELWDELKKLKTTGTEIQTYDWQPNRAPNEFQRDLIRVARDWYERQGLLE